MLFRWDTIEHPTFGRVPRVVSLKEIKAGTELSIHYMINMEAAAKGGFQLEFGSISRVINHNLSALIG